MRVNTVNRAASVSPFAQAPGGVGSYQYQELTHEAIVVDVVTNDSHPEYAPDGYNIGAVKFRAIKTDQYRPTEHLNWALPLEANITEYPLLNEIVLIFQSLNRFYYSKKLNVSSRVTSQPLFGLNEELSPALTSEDRSKDMRASVANTRQDRPTTNSKLGAYFTEPTTVFRLRSDEGDLLLEGRSGHSIRFGAAWQKGKKTNFTTTGPDQSPNLLIRVGPDPQQTPSVQGNFGLVTEDINADASSVYLVSSQLVPLTYATATSAVHAKSVKDFPRKLEGNQIVINTDRFVVNTKKDKILGHSLLGIHWTTNNDFTVDADRDYISTITRNTQLTIGQDWLATVGGNYEVSAGQRYSMIAPKIYVGVKQDDSQPLVCGELIAEFLGKFLDAFIAAAPSLVLVTSPPGSPSALNPSILAKLQQLKSDVIKGAQASFNSHVAYTTK